MLLVLDRFLHRLLHLSHALLTLNVLLDLLVVDLAVSFVMFRLRVLQLVSYYVFIRFV